MTTTFLSVRILKEVQSHSWPLWSISFVKFTQPRIPKEQSLHVGLARWGSAADVSWLTQDRSVWKWAAPFLSFGARKCLRESWLRCIYSLSVTRYDMTNQLEFLPWLPHNSGPPAVQYNLKCRPNKPSQMWCFGSGYFSTATEKKLEELQRELETSLGHMKYFLKMNEWMNK